MNDFALFFSLSSLAGLYVVWAKFTICRLKDFGVSAKASYSTFLFGPMIDNVHLMFLLKEKGEKIPSFIWIHWVLTTVVVVTAPYVWALNDRLMAG